MHVHITVIAFHSKLCAFYHVLLLSSIRPLTKSEKKTMARFKLVILNESIELHGSEFGQDSCRIQHLC